VRHADSLPEPSFTIDEALIQRAAALIAPYRLFRTQMLHSPLLIQRYGRPVHLKCENQQHTGSFKVRGALARLCALQGEERLKGVVAASAGNHALGVAWACRHLGIPGLVVVPESVPAVKLRKIQEMMIKVRLHGSSYDEAEVHARELAREAEATFVSPFDDPWVMAGNGGTVGLEIREQLPGCSAVVAPVGGGGLASGLAVALEGTPVVGVNSEASPAMARSLAEGRVYHRYQPAPTLAEGLEGGVTDNSVALCARHLHSVEVVAEESLAEAMRLMARGHGMVVEGSAAAGLAALVEQKPLPGDGPVCVVITGRNIDRERLREVLAR
jgi:threonine dehydratase